jgi:hypothetical protein
MWRILSIFVIIIFIFVSMTLMLGFAIGIGWLMTLFLPFTLFEASLLALIASIVLGYAWYYLLGSMLGLGGEIVDEDFPDEYDDDFDQIPSDRFFQSHTDKTWEAWLRHHLANSIYFEFQESSQPVAPMGKKQTQELAIRLADMSVDILKAKSVRAKRLNISAATLKKQMNKIGQRPYDDDILGLAAIAINTEVSYHYEELLRVIHTRLWKHPYDGFEAKGEF